MKRLLVLPLVLLALAQGHCQYGYLGAKNLVTVGINDRIWSDAWCISYFRVLSRKVGVRLEGRMLSVDRELRSGGYGWLGSNDGDKLGTVTGSGFGMGLHFAFNAGGGLSQPLGYYMSLGLEYTSGTTEEKLDQAALSPLWFAYNFRPALDYSYEHTVARMVYTWGIRKVIADHLSIDLGMELGWIFHHMVKTEDDLKGAMYALGFERNVFGDSGETHDRFGGFAERTSNMGMSITLTPMARFGVLF